jgi:hypothetical protein
MGTREQMLQDNNRDEAADLVGNALITLAHILGVIAILAVVLAAAILRPA